MALANNTVAEIGVARAAATGAVAWDFTGTATVPTAATTTLSTGWTNLGYIAEDGIGGSRDVGTDEQRDMNGDIVYRVQTDFTRTYTFTLLQSANVDVKNLIFGTANVTVTAATSSTGTLITANDVGLIGNHGRMIVTTFSGAATHREIIRDAQVTGVEFGPLVGTAVRTYAITVTAYKVNGVFVTELDDNGTFSG